MSIKMLHVKLSSWKEILASTAVSVASFPLGLGVVQKFLFKPLRITCKNPIATFLFGGCSVMLCGGATSCLFVASCSILAPLYKDSKDFELNLDFSKEDLLLCGLGSLVIFNFLGGKPRHVLPSHLFYPGAFARMSIPARGKNYASLSSKKVLNSIGRKHGCHSCGKKRQKYFVADHIPPNKLVKIYESQVFYPQCKTCSQKQGGALSSKKQFSTIQTHATTLKRHHFWFPLPLGIAMFKDILNSSIPTV